MKRYPVVIGATVAGLAGVLTFHSHSGAVPLPSGTRSGTNAASHGGSAHSRTKTTPPSGNPPPHAKGTGTITGALEQYGYGQLSVRVTMSGGKITKAVLATLQTADTYSQQLASQVVPILQREVLSAQSARINALSGATYTSEAYAYSVQSALDKLRK
ncbi:MAG TPA: FMN-binding protein [Acidimicrobiales bacterium]|jgi:uncharacterized protein with FMN-binding domain|nr:FMN-binding protein [Acidimicrobiales bacterium]